MKLYLRHRLSSDGSHATIWLIEKSGNANSGLLWGEILADRAEELLGILGALGIKIERDAVAMPEQAGPKEADVAKRQATLFDAFEKGEAT